MEITMTQQACGPQSLELTMTQQACGPQIQRPINLHPLWHFGWSRDLDHTAHKGMGPYSP